MLLYYLFIISIFFDMNFGMANSFSRIISIFLLVYMLVNNKGKIAISKLAIIQILIMLALLLSVIVNHGEYKEIFLIGEQALLYIVAYNSLKKEKDRENVIKCIGIVGTILSVIGLIEYVYYVPIQNILMRFRTIETVNYIENGHNRVSSTFINPIYFSAIIVLTIFIAQYFIKRRKSRHFWIVAWVLSIITLLLTRSEGGIFAFLIVELLFNISGIRRFIIIHRRKLIVLGVIIVLGATIHFTLNGFPTTVFVSIFTARVYAWVTAVRIFINNSLIGCGLGNYDTLFHTYGHEFIIGYYFERYAPHSDFFSMLANGGILAVVLFVWYTITQIKICGAMYEGVVCKNTKQAIFIKMMISIIVYFMIHRFIDDFYDNYRTITVFNILLATFERVYDNWKHGAPEVEDVLS